MCKYIKDQKRRRTLTGHFKRVKEETQGGGFILKGARRVGYIFVEQQTNNNETTVPSNTSLVSVWSAGDGRGGYLQ